MARNKKKLWKLLPLARAIGVLSAVGIATTLVTFAAIQSTGNALTGNTIQTATAALQISKDTNVGPWSNSVPGFTVCGNQRIGDVLSLCEIGCCVRFDRRIDCERQLRYAMNVS